MWHNEVWWHHRNPSTSLAVVRNSMYRICRTRAYNAENHTFAWSHHTNSPFARYVIGSRAEENVNLMGVTSSVNPWGAAGSRIKIICGHGEWVSFDRGRRSRCFPSRTIAEWLIIKRIAEVACLPWRFSWRETCRTCEEVSLKIK